MRAVSPAPVRPERPKFEIIEFRIHAASFARPAFFETGEDAAVAKLQPSPPPPADERVVALDLKERELGVWGLSETRRALLAVMNDQDHLIAELRERAEESSHAT